MTRADVVAHNRGVALVADLAARSAAAMRAREVAAPTRYPFATAALQAIADEASGLVLPMPPDGPEAAAAISPKPGPANGGSSLVEAA